MGSTKVWWMQVAGLGFLACAAFGCASSTDRPGGEVDAGFTPDASAVDAGPMDAPRCGDLRCDDSESCRECPTDCGECPMCSLAPTCTGAMAIPTGSERLESFDNGEETVYESGVEEEYEEDSNCLAPELRLRVRKLTMVEERNLFGGISVFCAITATDGERSELFVTELMQDVSSDGEVTFDPTTSTFWGLEELAPTMSNLTVTYKCFEANSDAFNQVVMGIEEGATDIAESGGGGMYGWIFGAAGVAAGLLADATSGTPDTSRRLDVQQTIDSRAFYDLTNGRIWQIEDDLGARIRLDIEAWGCADSLGFI